MIGVVLPAVYTVYYNRGNNVVVLYFIKSHTTKILVPESVKNYIIRHAGIIAV